MIIGAKRKEEVIKSKRYGILDNYTTPIQPVTALSVYKGLCGWEVWEMIQNRNLAQAYRPIARYKTKRETLLQVSKLAATRRLPII